MIENNISIVFVSNASWGYGLPTNRQQLPLRLADHVPVLYASPFSLSQVLLNRLKLDSFHSNLRQVKANLHSFDYMRVLPMVRGQVWPFTLFDRWLLLAQLRRHIRTMRFDRFILWLYYPPSFAFIKEKLKPSLTCYHCTDDHAGYAESLGFASGPIKETEVQLVNAVDLVFTTSRPLYERQKAINAATYLMPNVADVDSFRGVAEGNVAIAEELRSFQKPVVGFIGAVDRYKVDLDLVGRVAEKLPDWSFVFIGPVGTGDKTTEDDLPKVPNMHFLGHRPYATLPAYLAGFDVCIIPYNLNSYTAGVFPLKFWEYLACGKPVVTTALPALEEYYPLVEVADDVESFVAALKQALATNRDPNLVQQRLEAAAGQSWSQRAVDILKVLDSHL